MTSSNFYSLKDFGRYYGAADPQTLREIVNFLYSPEAFLRMQVASELKKPAVEALSEPLLKKFREDAKKDRVKQFIGLFTRRIMECNGYAVDQQNCLVCSSGNVFTRGTRYRYTGAFVNSMPCPHELCKYSPHVSVKNDQKGPGLVSCPRGHLFKVVEKDDNCRVLIEQTGNCNEPEYQIPTYVRFL